MEIKIRKAADAEMELLLQWRMRVLREVFSLGANADTDKLKQANEEYYRLHLADGSHTACFAMNDDGELIGCGGICYQEEMPSPDNENGTCGYLMNIYALPEYRGRGVGRKIVEYLLAEAKERGTQKIYLESSDMAMSLYQEIGFTPLEGYMKLEEMCSR